MYEYWKRRKSFAWKIRKEDEASMALLMGRAASNDMEFFTHFFNVKIDFDHRAIMREAIKKDHIWFIENWPSYSWEKTYAL
jgi:hypothetical protein